MDSLLLLLSFPLSVSVCVFPSGECGSLAAAVGQEPLRRYFFLPRGGGAVLLKPSPPNLVSGKIQHLNFSQKKRKKEESTHQTKWPRSKTNPSSSTKTTSPTSSPSSAPTTPRSPNPPPPGPTPPLSPPPSSISCTRTDDGILPGGRSRARARSI